MWEYVGNANVLLTTLEGILKQVKEQKDAENLESLEATRQEKLVG